MTIEVPYIFIQAVLYMTITYPMIGYYGSAYKIFWYAYAAFCAWLSYNYLGLLLVALTPNAVVASTISFVFLTSMNLFSGFFIQQPVRHYSVSHLNPKSIKEVQPTLSTEIIDPMLMFCNRKFQNGGFGCIIWFLHRGR